MTDNPSWVSGSFTVTCDPAKIDHAAVAEYLASSYWAKGIPRATVERSLAHSLCFAVPSTAIGKSDSRA